MAFYPRPTLLPKRITFPIRRPSDVPFFAPKLPSVLPPLPSPPRESNFLPGYTVTTHLVPAVSARYTVLQGNHFAKQFPSYQPISPSIPPEEVKTKGGRLAWANRTTEALIHRSKELREAWERNPSPIPSDFTEEDFGPLLWNVVNRYARVREQKSKRDIGLTVVVAHANGLHKETWEPTIRHLIDLNENPKTGIYIDEVWSFEAVNTGDSGLVNEGKFRDGFDWVDHARDILSFVENYIPEGSYVAAETPLPTHLERVSPAVATERRAHGFKDRNVVGVGHSLGGCSIANAACGNPKLFHSLTLIDPIIYDQPREWYRYLAHCALSRRQRWGSREEALAAFKKSAFFGVWEPEVLDLYVKYALSDVSPEQGGGVRLKMTGFDEATIFANPYPAIETYQLLRSLDTDVKLRWVMAGKEAGQEIDDERAAIMQDMVWTRIENSSNVIVKDSGHLITQERPYTLAKEILYGWRVRYAEKHDPIWNRL